MIEMSVPNSCDKITIEKKNNNNNNIYIYFFFHFFSPLMYNHTTSSQLYYKYLQNLQRLMAKYAQSAKTTKLDLRNTARKT